MKIRRFEALGIRNPMAEPEQKRYFVAFAKLYGLRRPAALREILRRQMEREPITQEEAA